MRLFCWLCCALVLSFVPQTAQAASKRGDRISTSEANKLAAYQRAVKNSYDESIKLAKAQGGAVIPLLFDCDASIEPVFDGYDDDVLRMMYPVACESSKINNDRFGGYFYLLPNSDSVGSINEAAKEVNRMSEKHAKSGAHW
ncbi:MAG: hypothetical protein Q8K75_06230 [Chlamydiales bacterium]|nr:hypothetical protein [Chlamydiales bacterium]